MQEHGDGVTLTVRLIHLQHFNGIIAQVVVEYHLAHLPEHVVGVIPDPVEAQHLPVVVQELLEGVIPLVWLQRLHGIIDLRE